MLFKIKYFLSRYGIGGLIKLLLGKIGWIQFDSYSFLVHHYYEKMDETDYEKELGEWYRFCTGRRENRVLKPLDFSDKIQWLKMHDDLELRSICSDKFRVRKYIEKQGINNLKLVPLLGVWEDVNDIDFSSMPKQFVLKHNASYKRNIIITDKDAADLVEVKQTLAGWMSTTFGYNGMELQYLVSPKRIVAEQYLQQIDGNLFDYKFFCFNGKPKFVEVIGNREDKNKTTRSVFLDMEWNEMLFRTITYPKFDVVPVQPRNFHEMIRIAENLSAPFRFVRIDLYNIEGEIFFGEMTFTPSNGIAKWIPAGIDRKIGEMIII